jgi:Fe-S oxidoreductase
MSFGAARLADLTQKNLLDASACLWCGRCHEVCPAAQTGKDLSPKKVMAICAEYIEDGKFNDDSLIDVLGQDAIFACTTCAACVEECPVSNNPAEVILEFRRHFVMDRSEMPETMAAANRNLESREHPFVGTSSNPQDWRKDLEVPFFEPGKTEYLLWIGCSVTYEERAQEIARAMVKILEAAGVSYGIFEEARCTGDPAKMMGNEMQFVEIAEANIEDFKEQKIQKVITMCAHCYNSFDRYYPELGADWQTIPHSVFIDELQAQGKLVLAAKSDEKITFHDPCYLARHNDIVDAPRNVIASVGQLIEMPRTKKESFCCGAGGGNYWGGQGGTARISDVRIQEAFDTGADKVATACSFCNLMLTSSSSKHSEERKVFDIAELVAEKITIID